MYCLWLFRKSLILFISSLIFKLIFQYKFRLALAIFQASYQHHQPRRLADCLLISLKILFLSNVVICLRSIGISVFLCPNNIEIRYGGVSEHLKIVSAKIMQILIIFCYHRQLVRTYSSYKGHLIAFVLIGSRMFVEAPVSSFLCPYCAILALSHYSIPLFQLNTFDPPPASRTSLLHRT